MTPSFCERLAAAAEAHPEKAAMEIVGIEGSSYTYARMFAAIRAVAARLEKEGIEFGDRVAVIGENHPSWAIAYLGILYRGAVCVPLDPQGELETLSNFIENSQARLAFIAADLREKVGEIARRTGRPLRTVEWDTLQHTAEGERFVDWANSPAASAGDPLPRPDGDDIALLIYTSGTTGTPKGVPLTHGNIVAELDGINEVLKLTHHERILSLLPLFHAYLQIVNLWVAATYGCSVGYLKELSPAELGEAMRRFRPTVLTTVPRLWYLFHKKIFDAVKEKPAAVHALFKAMLAANGAARAVGINLGPKLFGKVHESFGGNLRLAISAGSRFDDSVALDFHKLGFTILQGYGLTETSGAATATYEHDNRVGSVGKPMKGVELKIAEPDADGVGEVLIRGKIVFSGYYRNPEATAEAFTADGWFRSGDLGRFDADGHLYIVGRAKDVIVLPSGKNVHPEDLEVHYLRSPLVEELAVIGIADHAEKRAGAEKLAAIVVPDFEYLRRERVANSREAIRYALDNLGRELPEYQRVRDYIIRAEPLPRTGSRKIKRFQLKREIELGEMDGRAAKAREWTLTPADRDLLQTAGARTVAAVIAANALDAPALHPEMNLEIDLGLDSLARAETFAALEHSFSTTFDADEAARALTVGDVIRLAAGRESSNGDHPAAGELLNWSKIVRETPADLPEVKQVVRDRTVFPAFAFSVYKTFNLFCRVFMRLEVRGADSLRKMERPFLICPNHQSFLDPFVVCSNYPFRFFRHTFHVGAAMFFQNWIMRFAARLLQVVPVDPDTQLMKAMKAGAAGLKNRKILNIYPEGERAYDGKLHDFKKGASILATELDLPIVPVAIDGLYKVWARRSWRIRPAKVRIWFGEPFLARDVVPADEHDSEAQYRIVTKHLRDTVEGMIGEMRNQAAVQPR